MTDTKHTPGPWGHADTTREGHPKISGAGLSGLVATVGNAENNQNRIKADARLIAAAPELLAAAEHAAMSEHHPACEHTHPQRPCTCHVGKARIAVV